MKHPDHLSFNYKCRLYAEKHGYYGASGGWIYRAGTGETVCHGWEKFYQRFGIRIEYYLLKRYMEGTKKQ